MRAGAQSSREVRRESPIERGSIQIGGTASLTHTRDIGNDFETTNLDVMPRVGYFVARGLSVGLNLRHRRIWFDDLATVREQTFTEWAVGPGLTYFVPTKFRRVYPFISARSLFGRSLNKADIFDSPESPQPTIDDREARTTSRTGQAALGVMYMVVKHVGITGEAFYQRTRTTVQPGTPVETSNSAELYGVQWGLAAFIF
jgi:hypothetical protein